jgi:hypothetical protein
MRPSDYYRIPPNKTQHFTRSVGPLCIERLGVGKSTTRLQCMSTKGPTPLANNHCTESFKIKPMKHSIAVSSY